MKGMRLPWIAFDDLAIDPCCIIELSASVFRKKSMVARFRAMVLVTWME